MDDERARRAEIGRVRGVRTTRHRLLLLSPLLAATLLSGCSAIGPATSGAQTDAETGAPAEAPAATDPGRTPSTHGFPRISSCDQIAPIVSSYIQGLSLDQEYSEIVADSVYCAWKPADGTITSLTDIQTVSVQVTAKDGDVPDPVEAAKYGMDMYFTDPRLDALGGVGLWSTVETAAVGGGFGSVLVPGVEITLSDSRWDQEGQIDRNGLVTTALAILAL